MDINKDFWVKHTGKSFTTLFNQNNSKKGNWGVNKKGKAQTIIMPSDGDKRIEEIFTPKNIKLILGTSDMNVFQFTCLIAIMLNETGGSLTPRVGEKGSLAYCYNRRGDINKVSYNAKNTLGNKTAYDLFHDSTFMNVPARQGMTKPKDKNDNAWKGVSYPSNESKGGYEPKKNYAVGLISECDFYKFRGRGLIQLTGRNNYKKWMTAIRKEKNNISFTKSTSLPIINGWGSTDIDTIATKITNAELDTLFADAILSFYVLRTHSSSNRELVKLYNVKTKDEFVQLASNYGLRISGGKTYAKFFANRCVELMENIPNFTKT